MNAFIIMLRKVLMFVALAIPGFVLVKTKVFSKEQSGVLSKLLTSVAMLFFIMTSTMNNISFEPDAIATLGVAAIIGIGYTLLLFFVSKPLTFFEKSKVMDGTDNDENQLQDAKKRGMTRFCAMFSNNGFLGIPLANEVLGTTSGAMPVLIVINIITNLSMLTFGVSLVSCDKKQINVKKVLLNPVLIGFVLGLVFNLLDVGSYVEEIPAFTTHFSNLVTPISMTILGIKMGGVNLGKIFVKWKMYYVSAIKLIVCPVLIIAILFAVKYAFSLEIIDKDMMLGVFIAFSVPTAGLASALADKYDGDIENSVVYTLGSTILSIGTIPVLYMLLNLLI